MAGVLAHNIARDPAVAEPLLATKLYVPAVRATLVPRPRLVARLDDGLAPECRLVLISAPAGFGKTTLLVEWLKSWAESDPPFKVGWLALDDDDNDPGRFLAYLGAALRRAGARIDADSQVLPSLARPDQLRAALSLLINAIARQTHPMALVLDDYHLVEDDAIHDAMGYLIDHRPPNLHLVIAGRADPPLPLARLRARGQLVELRQADLRFTPHEAAVFLNETMGLSLTDEDVARLERRTEGWVAGLQLAALSLQGLPEAGPFIRAFSGGHHHVLDYLADEVLRRQPAEVRDFLLRTSILERLTASLCDAVLGGTIAGEQGVPAGSQSMLERLEAANLFVVPLDDERRWYRYHQLFAEFLRRGLVREQPGLVPILHRRASSWHEGQGRRVEAIEHALAGDDFERATGLVEAEAEDALMRSEVATFLGWVDTLPDALVRDRPDLCMYHAWALLLAARPADEVMARLREGEREGARAPGPMRVLRGFLAAFGGEAVPGAEIPDRWLETLADGEPAMRGLAAWYLGFVHLWRGEFGAAGRALDLAVATGRQTGHVMIATLALCHRAELYLLQGKLRAAETLYEEALDLAVDGTGERLPIAGMALLGLGELARERGLPGRAERLVAEGLARTRQWGELGVLDGLITLARLRHAQGDVQGADETLATALVFAQRFDATELDDRLVEAHRARLWALQGRRGEVEAWAAARGLRGRVAADLADGVSEALAYPGGYFSAIEYPALARALIAGGRPREGLAILDPLLALLEAAGRWAAVIEVQAVRALALGALGETAAAESALQGALALAEPEGYVRLLADEGEALAPLLRRAAARGIAPEYIGRLLAAMQTGEPTPQVGELVEPLSERELEVLRLIAAGLSNQEIADQLVLALSTIKWHINNLYGKLDAGSRTQAVARARELDLI